MTLIQFIRILYRNILLLLAVPIVLAVLVFYLTKNAKKEYETTAIIYTGIASGYSIESGATTKVDYFAANNAFDNLINIITSRSTMEEVAMRLFIRTAKPMADIPMHISEESHREISEQLLSDLRAILLSGTEEEQLIKISAYMARNDTNFVYRLLNLDHRHYSVSALSKIKVNRIANSDLLELSYKTDDAGICQQTLIILNTVFALNYKLLKGNQTDMVVRYFEAQLAKASEMLKKSEDELLQFNKTNNIINYYEQTKYIASQKEDLDLEYQREQMKIAGAKATLARLEAKMGFQHKIKLQNIALMKKRESLAEVSSALALAKLSGQDSLQLQQKAEEIKTSMMYAVDSIQSLAYTKEGLAMDDVLANWLKQVIVYEETNAKIAVLEERRREFRTVYKQFAPLGATIKRIEREIDVREREYLSLLHSLALAKLKQQNIELSSNLKIVDPPYFPIKPLPSKPLILVAAAGFAGFVFMLGILLALEFLDSTIRTDQRLALFSGLPCIGVYPRIPNKESELYRKVLDKINVLVIQHALHFIDHREPAVFGVISHQHGEGKSFFINQLATAFRSNNLRTLVVESKNDTDSTATSEVTEDNTHYSRESHFSSCKSINDILTNTVNIKDYQIVLFEFPAISESNFSVALLNELKGIYAVFRANRAFTSADEKLLGTVKLSANCPVEAVLNAAELETLESEVGSIPKKRSWIRKKVKNLLSLRHYEHENLS